MIVYGVSITMKVSDHQYDIIIWILRLINSLIEIIDFMMQQFLLGDILNMLFDLILTHKLIILGILSKFDLSIK